MGRGSVEAMLAALEQYLGGGGTGVERTPAQAYVAGVREGYELAREELDAAVKTDSTVPLGFYGSPTPPPAPTRSLRKDPSGSYPDPRSTARAIFERAGATLDLFPAPAREAPRRKRRSALPDEFRLTPELVRFAEAAGLNPWLELAAMRDHYRATGELRADWPAAYKSWCRKSVAFERRSSRR